jgi:hypothetical protein
VSSKRAITEADEAAKSLVSLAAAAAEDYRRHYGTWAGLTLPQLKRFVPLLKGVKHLSVSASPESFSIAATSPVTKHTFKLSQTNRHLTHLTCTPAGEGGCPASGVWRP